MRPASTCQPVGGGWEFLVAVDQPGGLQRCDIFPCGDHELPIQRMQAIFLVSFKVAMGLQGQTAGDGSQEFNLSGGWLQGNIYGGGAQGGVLAAGDGGEDVVVWIRLA